LIEVVLLLVLQKIVRRERLLKDGRAIFVTCLEIVVLEGLSLLNRGPNEAVKHHLILLLLMRNTKILMRVGARIGKIVKVLERFLVLTPQVEGWANTQRGSIFLWVVDLLIIESSWGVRGHGFETQTPLDILTTLLA
jgi:hypothetical protein